MERLQAAIDKARSQRDALPRPSARSGARGRARVPAAHGADVDLAWSNLTDMELDRAALPQDRIPRDSAAPGAAAFDLIRTRMLQQARQHGWCRIGVAAPQAGCGTTTVVANLLIGLARQADQRSLVFDFDLRRHGLSTLLGQSPDTDLVDVLQGRAPFPDLARRHARVAAAFANRAAANPAEILRAAQTAAVLDRLQATYKPDIMLFDLPPLIGTDDSLGFLERLDCLLIVAAAGTTTLPQIDEAERRAAELTSVMGIVLNKCRVGDPGQT